MSAVTQVPAAVTEADRILAAAEEAHDLACQALRGSRAVLRAVQEQVREREEAEHSAGLHMDTAARNAGLARKQAGVWLTATGYVKATP